MRTLKSIITFALALLWFPSALVSQAEKRAALKPQFQTSDRCLACHNGLTTPSGKDVSIGFDWRVEHHGQFRARSLLAGQRAPRRHRSS